MPLLSDIIVILDYRMIPHNTSLSDCNFITRILYKECINWFHYCLDYFSIRHFTDILLFCSFLFYIVLRFVKSILLNEYDDDRKAKQH